MELAFGCSVAEESWRVLEGRIGRPVQVSSVGDHFVLGLDPTAGVLPLSLVTLVNDDVKAILRRGVTDDSHLRLPH